jgi:glycosyltransferase involved in cell wall biosynthesis
MKLVFLSDNMNFSGGRKLFFEYAEFLRSAGHSVTVLVQEKRGTLADMLEVTIVPDFSSSNIPECDIVVTTTPREVQQAVAAKKGKVVHFCQGFEITDLEQRINGSVIPTRFRKSGFINKLKYRRKKWSWAKKKERIDKAYRLPTYMITVSQHLKDELEARYNRKIDLCLNGVREDIFHPSDNFTWGNFSESNPLKIVNIGPHKVTFKGIATTLSAIEKLKSKGIPVHFTRIAPKILEDERSNPVVDQFYENIPSEKLAEILRTSHIYISNSTEGEGFGLPALEALSSGTISILSSISSYRNFADNEDFALFVPEWDIDATVNAVEKVFKFTKKEACELRKNALKTAANFAFTKSCRRFEELLKKIVNN